MVIASGVFLPETRFSFSRRFSARRVSCWNHGRRNCAWPGSRRFRAAARFLHYPPPVIGKFRLPSRRRHLIGWSGNFARQQEASSGDKWTSCTRIITAGYWFYADRNIRVALLFDLFRHSLSRVFDLAAQHLTRPGFRFQRLEFVIRDARESRRKLSGRFEGSSIEIIWELVCGIFNDTLKGLGEIFGRSIILIF